MLCAIPCQQNEKKLQQYLNIFYRSRYMNYITMKTVAVEFTSFKTTMKENILYMIITSLKDFSFFLILLHRENC